MWRTDMLARTRVMHGIPDTIVGACILMCAALAVHVSLAVARAAYWATKPPVGADMQRVKRGCSGKIPRLVPEDVACEVVRTRHGDMGDTAVRDVAMRVEAAVATHLRASTVVYDASEDLEHLLADTAHGAESDGPVYEAARRDDALGFVAVHSRWDRASRTWVPDRERAHVDYVALVCVDPGGGRVEFASGKAHVLRAGDALACSAGPESRFRARGNFVLYHFLARPFAPQHAYVERKRRLVAERIWCA